MIASAKPLAILRDPRVAMKAGTFNFEIMIPFIKPKARPVSRQDKIKKIAEVLNFSVSEATAAHKANNDPIERSIPRDAIIKVVLIARIPIVEEERNIFKILSHVRKYGDKIEKTKESPIRTK